MKCWIDITQLYNRVKTKINIPERSEWIITEPVDPRTEEWCLRVVIPLDDKYTYKETMIDWPYVLDARILISRGYKTPWIVEKGFITMYGYQP